MTNSLQGTIDSVGKIYQIAKQMQYAVHVLFFTGDCLATFGRTRLMGVAIKGFLIPLRRLDGSRLP